MKSAEHDGHERKGKLGEGKTGGRKGIGKRENFTFGNKHFEFTHVHHSLRRHCDLPTSNIVVSRCTAEFGDEYLKAYSFDVSSIPN